MNAPILIFDSGVGGLSVVEALRAQLPRSSLAYACDNAALPYGTKPDAWLVTRIVDVCLAAIEASGASALVVACNTASTLALATLRARLDIPVVGTVPAIKPAAALSRSGTFGLLATTATVRRPYTDALIRDHAAHCRVVRVAADPLVAQAERQLAGQPLDHALIKDCLAPLWAETALDSVVLGCTHFPLLREAMVRHAPREIAWIDSGVAIARRVAQIMRVPTGEGLGPSWASAPSQAGLTAALADFGFAPPEPLAVARVSLC
ncbi:glutamate racemase [Halomonas sp. WWR20]